MLKSSLLAAKTFFTGDWVLLEAMASFLGDFLGECSAWSTKDLFLFGEEELCEFIGFSLLLGDRTLCLGESEGQLLSPSLDGVFRASRLIFKVRAVLGDPKTSSLGLTSIFFLGVFSGSLTGDVSSAKGGGLILILIPELVSLTFTPLPPSPMLGSLFSLCSSRSGMVNSLSYLDFKDNFHHSMISPFLFR